jgi:hypothetical protein
MIGSLVDNPHRGEAVAGADLGRFNSVKGFAARGLIVLS